MHFREGGTDPGRDGCRVPLPWSAGEPHAGFGTTAARGRLPRDSAVWLRTWAHAVEGPGRTRHGRARQVRGGAGAAAQ